MTGARLKVTRSQVLAFRRRVGSLDERLAPGPGSLRRAAWAGLQDSMPRAASLSINARLRGTRPDTWTDSSLVQIWGPRYSVFVVPRRDIAVFTLGRMPDDAPGRRWAESVAGRLREVLNGAPMTEREAARGVGVKPNSLKFAAPTGTLIIRWDGARQPTLSTVAAPEADPKAARLELARRYLHVYGPTTPESFARWAGISPRSALAVFDALRKSLTEVRTPVGDAWILAADEPDIQAPAGLAAPARLLPSGDAYFLLQGQDRELLIPDAAHRAALWPSRVWPGALLVAGEIVGTWRRAAAIVTVQTWKRISRGAREAVEAEAEGLPLPGVNGPISVRWET